MEAQMDRTLLIIDDEEVVCDTLGALMSDHGYEVTTAFDGADALKLLSEQGPEAYEFVLCDIKMPKVDGIEFLKQAKAMGCTATIVLMSAFGTVDTAIESMALGAYDYISKPFKTDEVLLTLMKAEEREKLIRENKELKREIQKRYSFENIVARSPKMRNLIEVIRKVADYRSSIIITGERGSGKELLARAIHYNSSRQNQPFVSMNCCSVPEHLLESELMGHERGAFTDATKAKRGLFEEAQGGTLFLDEVSALPLFLQAKLLKTLQEGVCRRVGGASDIAVDVRVIAASIKDLTNEVKQGRFRDDLYYRLNVIPFHIPPLRERREDIIPLAQLFIEQYAKETGKQINSLSPEAAEGLLKYSWKGNGRELENIIERAVVMADGSSIDLIHINPWIQEDSSEGLLSVGPDECSIKQVVSRIEKELISRALRKTKGNRTKASRLLEISHRTLLYKIKGYELEGL